MKIRFRTLWRVPIFCIIASLIGFYLTAILGRFFFVVTTVGNDGSIYVSADPLRTGIFNAVLFLLILFVGGLWACRSMSKAEVAVSAGITGAVYLIIVVAQILVPSFPVGLTMALTYVQSWTAIPASFLMKLGIGLHTAAVVSAFAPLLFIIFGRKTIKQPHCKS